MAIAGGSVPIDAALAQEALQRVVARPLGIGLLDAAFGVHRLANATMMRAVKAVSTNRGRDPRDFVLFAFGGNGGIHAAALARELQMKRIVVPPAAGVFSALGLLFADFEVARSLAFLRPLNEDMRRAAETVLARLEDDVFSELGEAACRATLERRADLRYTGQAFELPLTLAVGDGPNAIRAAFEREHERIYGHRLAAEVQFVTLRVIGTVAPAGLEDMQRLCASSRSPGIERSGVERSKNRIAYFGDGFGLLDTPVLDRPELDAVPRRGPLVIEEYEGTTVVPPDATARLDDAGNIVIAIEAYS